MFSRTATRRVAFAFSHKELTDSLPRRFKIAFAGCPRRLHRNRHQRRWTADALIRDGVEGFLPHDCGRRARPAAAYGIESPARVYSMADDPVRRIEAVIRVFQSVHGNRQNKNKARLKFVLRERGLEWLRDTIEEQYQDILKNGGIAMPDQVPENFGGASSRCVRRWRPANCCRCGSLPRPRSPNGAKPTCVRKSRRAIRSSP